MISAHSTRLATTLLLGLLLSACTTQGPYKIHLMPAPGVYSTGVFDPFEYPSEERQRAESQVFYATDRNPATDGGDGLHYANRRGYALRVGTADIVHGDDKLDWGKARRMSLLRDRDDEYPLQVEAVNEMGILRDSVMAFHDPVTLPSDLGQADERYAEAINKKVADSRIKDIFIYVHGYKVAFENPLLVATELWHFMGYEGVMIAYSWPSTPSLLAYMSDAETAALSARYLRKLIEFLSESTDAERINILGYSAGTRVVINALSELSLRSADTETRAADKLRIGQVILVGSDYDKGLFGVALDDGLLGIVGRLTIYLSKLDGALSFSNLIFGRERLGQFFTEEISPHTIALLSEMETLSLIDVSDAANAGIQGGHAYFRQSPWVSSDVLINLVLGLTPDQRGLVRKPGLPIWIFPPNYLERLQSQLKKRYPEQSD